MILTSFNLENILSSIALETGTAINNLIIDSTSLQPVLLDDVLNVLRHVTRYETWREKESSLHILLIVPAFQKIGNR